MTLANYIPFITGKLSVTLAKGIYDDAFVVRTSLDRIESLSLGFPGSRMWIDPGVDGMHDVVSRRDTPWYHFMTQFDSFEKISTPSFWERPNKDTVSRFVVSVLDYCHQFKPKMLSVPQLPQINGVERNKINRAFAKATGEWKARRSYRGQLILPVIFTNQRQLNGKTERNRKIQTAGRCYSESSADGIWIVDSSLCDDSGSPTLKLKRFPGIISLHEELNEKIPTKIRIAGPYWGLNLVLSVRGLATHGAIGVGTGYQYSLTGGTQRTPKAKLALAPLRRRAIVESSLKEWLRKTTTILPASHPEHRTFKRVLKQFHAMSDRETARRQVAVFYRDWWHEINAIPAPGRPMGLFQDLSGAYALGKILTQIADKGTDRQPEAVVEPLMLSCL